MASLSDPIRFDRRAIPHGMTIDRWHAADGWPLRRFAWAPDTLPPRGSLLFQSGRADFAEKYLEALAHWQARGWHVTGFDWRGQGGSGRLSIDPRVGHLAGFDPLVADQAAFVADWIAATPAPHVIVAHSMGAHLTLRMLAERQPPIAAAALLAPMLGLVTDPWPVPVARAIAWAAELFGLSQRAAWKERAAAGSRRQINLTACLDRYADEAWWEEARPDLAMGAPSWGWLDAAFASMAKLDRPGALETIDTPLLILGAAHDRLVSADAIRRAARRLPDARLDLYDDSAHELLRERDAVRLRAFAAIDAFLDARAPARAG